MKRILWLIAGLLAAAAIWGIYQAMSKPGPGDDVLRELTVDIEVDQEGILHVTETLEWDFGEREGLGFTRELFTHMGVQGDPGAIRLYRYDDFQLSSPSGAPTQRVSTREDGEGRLYGEFGADNGTDDTRRGVQTYVLEYEIHGAMNPIRGEEGVENRDELYWNVTGSAPIDIDRVETRVTGPSEIIDAGCWEGMSLRDRSCGQTESETTEAVFISEDLRGTSEQTVMVAFEEGTAIGPEGEPRYMSATGADLVHNYLDIVLGPVTRIWRAYWQIFLAFGAAVAAVYIGVRAHRGRDWCYTQLQPGQLPPAGSAAQQPLGRLMRPPRVQPRSIPPEDLNPAEVAVLNDKARSSIRALTATLLDLAGRGLITMEPVASTEKKGQDWRLTKLPAADRANLSAPERALIHGLFWTGDTIRLSQMSDRHSAILSRYNLMLEAEINAKGLLAFDLNKGPAGAVGGKTFYLGLSLWFSGLTLGMINVWFDLHSGLGGLGWGLFLVTAAWGALSLSTKKLRSPRTARGRAYYEQVRGFRAFIQEQGRGADLSALDPHTARRGLAYAAAVGAAKDWAELAEQAHQAGTVPSRARMYVVPVHGTALSLSDAVSSFSGSVTSATVGSSGGSAAGGGGFGGGGAGGGGGGGGFGGR
ncbi:DUF2207 domain-containing protein [Nesterenkonia sp. MY13]|uniref:DUF2207 domain-containing protein n=1 Tax=Nesterenkonia sedimenti TaxID=1463632 RepID=A0A7X8TKE8_9MICC|nr:DUF2207 domain-containing protein [Nesterenkonia sedimenti]NLS10422.1 DUF2207 domain-containing protein [Nesterenkonia sedimenti]